MYETSLSPAISWTFYRPSTLMVPSPQTSCRTLPSPLSELEAKFYYAGLHSAPVLVARTGTTPWEVPTGPGTYQKLEELRVSSTAHPTWAGKTT